MGNIKLGLNDKKQLTGAFWDRTLSWQRFLTWFGGEKTPDMQYGDVSPVSNIFNFEGNYTRQLKNGYYNTAFFAHMYRQTDFARSNSQLAIVGVFAGSKIA